MSKVSVDSHEVLGKLSVVKNYLSVLSEGTSLVAKEREYLSRAQRAAESLITDIKNATIALSKNE